MFQVSQPSFASPLQAALVLAGGDGGPFGTSFYDLDWGVTKPPDNLSRQIFPWVEERLAQINEVRVTGGS
jgi:hypothetical protein